MKQRLVWPVAAALFAACAQVRDPQGGPKDSAPPVLLAAVPANGSVSFTADRIVLRFDERITLDRVREKLLVSPPLEKAPDVSVSGGRDVVVQLRAPLKPNTTYTFNIGDAIADLSEGNHALGLTYVLSTGDHLDSLKLHGTLRNALSGDPAEGVAVLLHDANDTTTVATGAPAYFTRTTTGGAYRLGHLRPGTYRLTALRDQNANYRYDLPNEDIAFADSVVVAGDTSDHVLSLFRQPPAEQQVIEARVLPDRCWRLVLARPGSDIALRSLDREGDPLRWSPEWSTTRDTVLLWPSDTTLLDEQRFEVRTGNEVLDTLTYRPLARMPFYVGLTLTPDTVPGLHLLTATRPLTHVDTARVHVRSVNGATPVRVERDSLHPRSLKLIEQRPLGERAELELLPGAVTDRYGASNDTLRLPLGTGNAGAGDLLVRIRPEGGGAMTGPAVLQLIGMPEGRIVREFRSSDGPVTASWRNLAAGTYALLLIDDRNGDGRWSTGDFPAQVQPERTYRYPQAVTVRVGWNVAIDWSLER